MRAEALRTAMQRASRTLSPAAPNAPGSAPSKRGDAASAAGAGFGKFARQGGKDSGADRASGPGAAHLFRGGGIAGDESCDLPIPVGDLATGQFDHDRDGGGDFGPAGAMTVKLPGVSHDRPPACAGTGNRRAAIGRG